VKHTIDLRVNGEEVTTEVESHRTLLEFLRDQLHLMGVKEGCGDGECGACTVLLNGEPVRSCLVLAAEVQSAEILTIEGLVEDEELHPLQQAFIDQGAVQCGFCTPGLIMGAKALLDRHSHPSEEQIREAIGGHLCRCTGYETILQAIRSVTKRRP
jgi:aerobic-type carbon monoxide dehydrogenase small subunit (CoxS/CutS family)